MTNFEREEEMLERIDRVSAGVSRLIDRLKRVEKENEELKQTNLDLILESVAGRELSDRDIDRLISNLEIED